jgi:hypothetical protein
VGFVASCPLRGFEAAQLSTSCTASASSESFQKAQPSLLKKEHLRLFVQSFAKMSALSGRIRKPTKPVLTYFGTVLTRTCFLKQNNCSAMEASDSSAPTCHWILSMCTVRRRLKTPMSANAQSKVTWLILPVVICLSQRLSHACLSINDFIL